SFWFSTPDQQRPSWQRRSCDSCPISDLIVNEQASNDLPGSGGVATINVMLTVAQDGKPATTSRTVAELRPLNLASCEVEFLGTSNDLADGGTGGVSSSYLGPLEFQGTYCAADWDGARCPAGARLMIDHHQWIGAAD